MRQAGLFLALAIGMAAIAAAGAHAHAWIVAIAGGVLALWLASLAVRAAKHR